MKFNLRHIYMAILAAIVLTGCSTTKRLGKNDVLYTGLKGVDIETPAGEKFPADVKSSLTDAVSVRPNNSLFGSSTYRFPIPYGLWIYNNWAGAKRGPKKWIYDWLAEEPVLVSEVRPEVRVHMLDQILDNNGYFSGTSTYELVKGKNKKKASILYKINSGRPYLLDSVAFLPDSTHLNHIIDSVARASKYFRPGSRYSTDSLAALRVDIANTVRNRGYYYFRPDYITYLADSLMNPGSIAIRMDVADNLHPWALDRFKTGKITTIVSRNKGGGVPDTIQTNKGTLIRYMPSRLREGLIPSCIVFNEGRTFSVRQMDLTQTRLSRLGIFNNINITVLPDTVNRDRRLLDVLIECTFDRPLEASVEANVSSKSNSYLGPGLSVGVTNRNIFGGGEQLNVTLTGSYEWQTGSGRSSAFNSYELGLNGTLAFPRMLAPKFIPRSRRDINWTRLSLGVDMLNRPHYFKMYQFNTGISYDWRSSKYITNTFTPFKLTYTKLQHTTEVFDSIMKANPAIALSFMDQFIPQMTYSMIYDRAMNRDNTINVQVTLQQAGNIFWSIYELCGKHGEKTLFHTPFSQFIKGYGQIVYGRRLMGKMWLVNRVAVGAAYAYGNSKEVPYSEQFYAGGANSIRAFTVRSIGPGSYRAPADQINGYFDQTGNFIFLANSELRFPIIGPLEGAAFLDAGNVWTLKNEPSRPGGQLRARTFLRDIALGTGVGLRVNISMLVIRGDLGIGIHAPYHTSRHGYYNMESFGKSLAFHLAIGYPF
ncbi:MAG: BamA/TamA family outer membrane protein [Muribaculaceae bacterium]|nr:BamA/TamA family outer membrane protein [Muribaculaceae bacterium]